MMMLWFELRVKVGVNHQIHALRRVEGVSADPKMKLLLDRDS